MLKGMRKVVFVVCVVSKNLWNWFSELVVYFICCHDVNLIVLVLVLFNYHIIRYVHFRDFKQKIYNKIKIAKIVKLLD